MPQISIITPVYIDVDEKVNWLDEMIQSAISQTYTDWELILIDDKSPISSDSLKSKYANDVRIRWLANAENNGPAKTRNTAVALAESDCILPLDSDDILASNDVLERMYDVWQQDKTKIIYGNLQLLIRDHSGFKRSKVFSLGEYTFEMAMHLEGIMPVTAMHSVQCHQGAGGWKHELNEGLEDLEYWIAAGEHGFCGQKIQHTTLLYRRQENSRAYKLKHINQNFSEMQQKIKDMHAPIYRGEFPMGCCGKGKANAPSANVDPVIISNQNQSLEIKAITALASRGFDFDESEMEWVAYRGPKRGSGGRILVRDHGGILPPDYPILGYGHVFQIHKRHHKLFSDRQKLGYQINQPDPRAQDEPELVEIPEPEPQVIQQAKPELSTIVRLDRVASETREAEIIKAPEEAIIEPNAPVSYSDKMTGQDFGYEIPDESKGGWHVNNLKLSDKISTMLSHDHWTVEKLAETTPDKLTIYDGIGNKRASTIINKAKELINSQ